MSLSALIDGVEAHEKTLTVVNPSTGTVEAVCEHFSDRNIVVEADEMASGPDDYMVLSGDDGFLAAARVDTLIERRVLDPLDETMFTTYDNRRMLAASREIEDRAWRVGGGTLHAGFQVADNLDAQRETYERLGGLDDLSVHTYVHESGGPPDPFENVRVHVESADEIQRSWFVVFDGAGVDENRCALVAESRENGFYGFWTYDPDTVTYALNHLESTYRRPEDDDRSTSTRNA